MATAVDIANLALSHLGDRATVTSLFPAEGSAQADACARFYPIARDRALEEFSWTFATRREALTLTDFPTDTWLYAYYKPNDCIFVQRLVAEPIPTPTVGIYDQPRFSYAGDQGDFAFEMMADATGREVILTNMPNAYLQFTARVVDPSKFSSQFVDALAYLLASYLSGTVLKGKTGATAATANYNAYVALASAAATRNANQANHRRDFVPQSMGARGVYFPRPRGFSY